MSNTISVIGLGAMGTALANALIDAGNVTTVWNRTSARADALVARGARRAETVTEAIAASDLIVLCLTDYAAVEATFHHVGPGLSGKTVVNLTNGRPNQVRAIADRLGGYGALYLDGGIMATPPMIGSQHAFILYSGSADAFASAKDRLVAFGRSQYLGEDPILAAVNDLALLSAMYGLFGGYLHATALAGSVGVSATAFLSLVEPWLAAMMTALPDYAERIDSGDHARDVMSNLAMQAVAITNIVAASRSQGIDPAFMEPMERLAQQRLAGGFGTDEISGIIEAMRAK
ncbi:MULTISPECIES: NAD(P)-binding domain-containing protein [unclassified Ensifer]|uniref:NAD(P)-dependent oxidoreductase n=1 Tax=unclassified Ensifer TaxID=2633371 RepID=UPI0008131FF7|nr:MULTISPECIES: NAD(P)-binding domain-containing protein [unclassified Ensifer]OCP17353.1 6-phosphogluconate dehydrogenase [Ensifer sp. LC54]OCP28742.1 6-phosphogluconate dehydrogenase [Ensifer sp. LC384]OCP38992.1 6-phosphogluconate dehydrogenase [Ensifer sp. LC163]